MGPALAVDHADRRWSNGDRIVLACNEAEAVGVEITLVMTYNGQGYTYIGMDLDQFQVLVGKGWKHRVYKVDATPHGWLAHLEAQSPDHPEHRYTAFRTVPITDSAPTVGEPIPGAPWN